MSTTSTKPAAPSEPDPQRWLTPERLALLQGQLTSSASLLRQAGLWRAALGYWVRWQASLEADWPADQEQAFLDEQLEKWYAHHSLEAEGLTVEELRAKLRVAPAVARWSRQQWGHKVESLYLQRKNQLDKASCRLLRAKDKNLILELYHRIKAGETSFEKAARDFSIGPERHQGGLLPMQPLERMPLGLAPLLERMEPGRLSLPMRLGSAFCLVQLEAFEPTQLNVETEELLLAEQMRLWIDAAVNALVAALRLTD